MNIINLNYSEKEILKVKILGYGEIGRSLAEVYRRKNTEPAWADQRDSYGEIECDLLNICIPYSDQFGDIVVEETRKSKAKYVVIHSTVKVGTTKLISEVLNLHVSEDIIVCHTPVIGIHPNLTESMLTFIKWIGINEIDDNNKYLTIFEHFWHYDVKAQLLGKPEATEIMKLWDTTYYGMCLAINAEIKKMLEENNINYQTWIKYLKAYNQGYKEMEMPNVQRPYFQNLQMPIGGHCIIPNYKILKELTDMSGFNLLEKYSK